MRRVVDVAGAVQGNEAVAARGDAEALERLSPARSTPAWSCETSGGDPTCGHGVRPLDGESSAHRSRLTLTPTEVWLWVLFVRRPLRSCLKPSRVWFPRVERWRGRQMRYGQPPCMIIACATG